MKRKKFVEEVPVEISNKDLEKIEEAPAVLTREQEEIEDELMLYDLLN